MASSSNPVSNASSRTAGIIVIGDEVLKGQVQDINSSYIASQLYKCCIKLRKISVVPDSIAEISSEVKEFSDKYDYVFTTGGIGPTHDDISYAGISGAFGEKTKINEEMMELLRKWLGGKYEESLLVKMAELPPDAELIYEKDEHKKSFPIIKTKNIYIFPGIPSYLQKMFPRLAQNLKSETHWVSSVIYINSDELKITHVLNSAVQKFNNITFGSYPILNNSYFSTKITLEGPNIQILQEARDFFKAKNLPLVDFDSNGISNAGYRIYEIVENEEHELHLPVKNAVTVLEDALSKYSVDELCICFNGGKDCTALLHLFYGVVQKKYPQNEKISGMCIRTRDGFPEMETFIQETIERYKIDLLKVDGPIKNGLSSALESHQKIRAVLMGTRRTDPSGKNLNYFQMTDESWPQVMRISPILDWTYSHVWKFLRSLTLPYCSLYDQGYTSIGSKNNTSPNESLKYIDANGLNKYHPAYTLNDMKTERNGRE